MEKLKDKIALITGGTSGMGEAFSIKFANEGAQVIVVGRNKERGQQIVDESKLFGQNVTKIYDTIDGMVSKNYLSSESTVIANEIKSYQQNLINITKTIESYGIHCQNSAREMAKTRNNIIDGIR